MDILKALFYLTGLLGFIVGVWTYRASLSLQRAKWLSELYDKFYHQDRYHEMRKTLDYMQPDEIKHLSEALNSHSENALEEEFVDYLNFFHFIAILVESNQITHKEVNLMFSYYISMLRKHDFIINYMKKEGFNTLVNLVTELK
ncbi:MAG: hypothetical protein ACYC45_02420 [Acidithiobacillus ferriphilus]